MSESQDSSVFATSQQPSVDGRGPASASLGEVGDQYLITHEALDRTLRGLVVATKLDDGRHNQIQKWLSQQREALDSNPLSVNQWLEASRSYFSEQPELYVLTNLIVGIAYMRERGRRSKATEDELSLKFIWPLVYAAISKTTSLFKASRSAAGFIWVPLCSLVNDGAIDELWRLHVWLPDGHRGNSDFQPHDHHAYGQSWILAGEGTNHRWSVEPVADEASATHARYYVAWDDGKKEDSGYKTHQVSSTVRNSHEYCKATHLRTETERRNMTYSVSHEEWHHSEVAHEAVFATLFFFDAHRGVNSKACILGPKDGVSSTQIRDPDGNTPEQLVRTVEVLRRWEDQVAGGDNLAGDEAAKAKTAEDIYRPALDLCRQDSSFPNREYYAQKTLDGWRRADPTVAVV